MKKGNWKTRKAKRQDIRRRGSPFSRMTPNYGRSTATPGTVVRMSFADFFKRMAGGRKRGD